MAALSALRRAAFPRSVFWGVERRAERAAGVIIVLRGYRQPPELLPKLIDFWFAGATALPPPLCSLKEKGRLSRWL